jgi:curved DNA-binding protein CbpA
MVSMAALVLQRHAQLGQLNHFELLEVPEDAGDAEIRRAFLQAVERFRPDRLGAGEEQLRPLAQEIVCRIGAAFRVLEDSGTRRRYQQSLGAYPHLAAVRSSMPARPSNPVPGASDTLEASWFEEPWFE